MAAKTRQPLVEYVPCAFLALMGVLVLIDASTLSNNRTGVDPLGPRAVPIVVGVVSLILAVALAVSVRRGHLAEAESGEDIDLEHEADVKTVLLLIGVFTAQHPAHRHARLGDQRRVAVLRVGNCAGQPALHPGPVHRRRPCRWAPSTPSRSASASTFPRASCKGFCNGKLPTPTGRLRHRRHSHQPAARAHRGHGRHRGRGVARHRSRHDGRLAAADHLRPRADRGDDHARRHLVRRHVRRIDHVDPVEHPRRVVVGGDRHRGQSDGEVRTRRRRRSPRPPSDRSWRARSARCWWCSPCP